MQTTITLTPGDSVIVVVAPAAAPSPLPPAIWDLSLPIADMAAYLVQRRAPDGAPSVDRPDAVPQTAGDAMTWRKRDYRSDGSPGGYCASDAVADYARSFFVTTWQFAPYQGFNPTAGDGGEVYTSDGTTIRADATQDGGIPGVQFFVGSRYGGNGWVVFDNLAPTGAWRSQLDRLSEASDPNAEPPLGQAFTRWRREVLALRFRIFGEWRDLTLPCIIYEHWNGSSVAGASDMEQAIWALGWGRVWWAFYKPAPVADLALRVPALPWPAPSDRPDCTIQDARLWTDIVSVAAGEASVTQWPPAGFVQ